LPLQNIKGVIFDLDGTLYTLKHMKLRMALILWSSIGFLRNLFAARAVARAQVFNNSNDLLYCVYTELAKNAKRSSGDAEKWYQNTFMPAFIKLLHEKAVIRSDVKSLLKELKQKEIKLGIVSDFSHVKERVAAIGLDPELFDILKASEEFGVLKPSPEPVLGVAHEWNIASENIIMVGDRDDMDGECARRANMGFVGITDKTSAKENFFMWKDALNIIRAATDVEKI